MLDFKKQTKQKQIPSPLRGNVMKLLGQVAYSHAQLSVVYQVLQWIHTGEHIHDVRAIRDCTNGWVHGGNHAGHVDMLNI